MNIRTVCAACQLHLSGDLEALNVSHGLCPACLKRMYPEFSDDVLADVKKYGGTEITIQKVVRLRRDRCTLCNTKHRSIADANYKHDIIRRYK